ncbi:MAG: hypothetical protein JKY95_07790 [Planctomycetaceae bacterium]|nr:hypothetical protein [Planctomycetaceae bacterium]
MALQFNPTILKQGAYHELPGPITKLQIQDRWDFSRYKVLLEDGDGTAGVSRNGVEITIAGQVAAQDGELLLQETEMFGEIEQLRSLLDTSSDTKFSFFLYRDVGTSTYRYFQNCTVARFQYNLSRADLYTYSILIHAEDPVLQTVLPVS